MSTREYAKNLFTTWSDEDFCNQPVFDKLLYQVLCGQRAVNSVGIQPINFTRWRKAMRDGDVVPPEATLRAALARMEHRHYVYTDEDTGELLIRSRMRRDDLDKQPTHFLAALRLLAVLDSPKFAWVLAAELDRMDIPVVKGDKAYTQALRDNLAQAYPDAHGHLKALAEQYVPDPPDDDAGTTSGDTPGPTTGPTLGGSPGVTSRPGETGPTPGDTPGGTRGPSGSGSVSGSVTLASTQVGDTHARKSDEPIAQPRCSACNAPLWTGADHRAHPSGKCPDCRRTPTDPGDDPEPPMRCKAHTALPADAEIQNCGPCANFSRSHAAWEIRDRRRRLAAQSAQAHAQAALKAEAIAACALCDPDGYRLPARTAVCDHIRRDDDSPARAAARAAAARKTPADA